jgi:Zn-dependent peptidase ImmA (M78 family)
LERLAYDLYKRPLAIFFLPEPPSEPNAKAEFRSLPDQDLDTLERDTLLLIRKARAFQIALGELYGGQTPADHPIWRTIELSVSRPIPVQAAQIRDVLGITVNQQSDWKDADIAMKQWRRAIELRGVFIFKHTFKQREISGFCLNHNEFPVVMVNNSTTKTRQIFSLLHELAHILFRRNGISAFDETRIDSLPSPDRAIERFCNAIAAEVLVPISDFRMQLSAISGDVENADEGLFENLATRYQVSRAVVLRRMLDERRVSTAFYLAKTQEWNRQKSSSGSGGDYYKTQNAYLSERFLREVFARYARRQISRDDVAELIDVAPKNLAKLEDLVLRGIAA